MRPQYHNPENITQEQLDESGKGWRFVLKEEISCDNDQCLNFGEDPLWVKTENDGGYSIGLTYRTKRPLPIEYLTGDNAEAFDDPAYQRSVEHYFHHACPLEVLIADSQEWKDVECPVWDWEYGVRYRLSAGQQKNAMTMIEMTQPPKRKIIHIACTPASEHKTTVHGAIAFPPGIFALCDDGTLWAKECGPWSQIDPIPQSEAAPEVNNLNL